MRLLYITSTWFVDSDFPLIRHLIKAGVDVQLCIKVFSYNLSSTLFDLKQEYSRQGITDSSVFGNAIDFFKQYLGLDKIHIINITKESNLYYNPKLVKEEIDLIEQVKPDVIHHIAWPFVCEYPIQRKYGTKFLLTIHDPVPHEINRTSRIFRLYRRLTKKAVNHYVLLNSRQIKDFTAYYGISQSCIHLSRLGNIEALKIYGKTLTSNPNTVLFFGRISPYKGIEYLLEAFANISNQFPDIKLVVAGSGKFHFDIGRYESNPQIEFINRYINNEELATLINNCQFVVCPYISATQSGVVASSFAFNKPVLATKVGGLPDMIQDGVTGLLVKERDTVALEKAMTRLLSEKDLLQKMSENINSEAINGETSWTRIVNKYIEIYKQINIENYKKL